MAASAKKTGSRKRRSVTPSRCSVCKASGAETYWFFGRSFIFDVDRAREITQDGRKPILLDRSDVRFAVDTSRIHRHHVPHVNVKYPGIVARVRFVKENGKTTRGDLLIDGNHRAARSLQLGRPFYVYVLTHDETDAVLKRRPDAARRRKLRTAGKARRVGRRAVRVAKKQR